MSAFERHRLPTRLLDVGPGPNVEPRLVETTGYPEGQWVALSHCWGEVQSHPLKTTRNKLAERLAGIPLSSMPKSFIDAIAVTKALGLRYIWIDSLCIIQEDEDDWLAESKTMGSVYERAVLTIAASSAEDSTKGLFIRRPYAELKVPTVQVPFMGTKSPTGASESLGEYSIGIEWRQEPFMKELDPIDTALSKRGWATQEWILSRRIIHFLDRGMVWVCKSHVETETGYFIVGRGLPRKEISNEWGQLVQEHSNRLFTYARDRLVSLEGLASKYRHFKPVDDFYAYGIWGSDMPLHLLWSPRMLAWEVNDQPSWSWVSCPREIWFRIRQIATRHDCESFTSQCRIFGVDQKTGALKLNARKKEIKGNLTLKFDLEDKHISIRERANHQTGYYITISDTDTKPFGWAVFDDGERGGSTLKAREDQRIFFLYLSDVEFSAPPCFESYGLLLSKAQAGKEEFVRIGVAAISRNGWIKDQPEVDVDII
ncbi:hypothetical protein IFR05_002866 [Cadophora sp. M221]|nr:hypothetical protein IFR05_002866 [Cadophora sp. M221]